MQQEQRARPRGRRRGLRALALAGVLAVTLTAALPARAAQAPAESSGGQTQARRVIPLGRAVGIKLFSDGVMVVGFSQVGEQEDQTSPARDCGLKEGDIITHINSVEVDTIEQVQDVLQQAEGEPVSIRCLRGEDSLQVTAQAVRCGGDGQYRLGAWIRDSMAGIGTLTYYDPDTGSFGALGHGINDVDTAQLMPLQSGSILYAQVTDVQKGESGKPGQLHGAFRAEQDMGELWANTDSGVFGRLDDVDLAGGLPALEVAHRSQVKTGAATILSNIAGEQVEEYQVEITRIYPESAGDTRNLMIKVTDPRLLEATGGIVQGMSGSPILQDGRIVGAVTHVLVNDPTSGYGILMENMLETAGEEV